MNQLIFLIPAALLLGGLGLAAFLWCLKSGQFDDPDGAAQRILQDEEHDFVPSSRVKSGPIKSEPFNSGPTNLEPSK